MERRDLKVLESSVLSANHSVSARIPHQSAARTSLADSFSPGEAMAAAPHAPLNDPLPVFCTMRQFFSIKKHLFFPFHHFTTRKDYCIMGAYGLMKSP